MFGLYRYALALMVVYAHVWRSPDGGNNWFGLYAVFSFYMLSGYLMTLVLTERYDLTTAGMSSYLINRFLRIYPVYWVVLALAIPIAWIDPRSAFMASPFFHIPPDIHSWLKNLLVVGLHRHPTDPALCEPVRLIPPAWTLSVEVLFYVAMGVLLSRSRRIVAVWLAASVVYTAVALAQNWSLFFRVSTVYAASLPFSLGAAIYFLPGYPLPRRVLAAVCVAFAAHVCAAGQIWQRPLRGGLYTSLVLSAFLLYGLRSWKPQQQWVRTADRFAGDLAYPLFLCHCSAVAIVISAAYGGVRPAPGTLLLASLLPVHVLAFAIHAGVAAQIEPLRNRIRGQSPT